MQIRLYQLDAFTNEIFRGNPAAVCPLDAWLPDDVMQAIAAENNLSETAFFVPTPDAADHDYHLRWFTPASEIDLCGHATLASAAVIFRELRPELDEVTFQSLSGPLVVRKDDALLELDFPARPVLREEPVTKELVAALGARPTQLVRAADLFAIYDDPDTVRTLTPDFSALGTLDPGVIAVSAPGEALGLAYVCRAFAPGDGINEDPVTGRIQTTLAPYWAERLGTNVLPAKQLSARGGDLRVTLAGDRVRIAGEVAFVLEGTLTLPEA